MVGYAKIGQEMRESEGGVFTPHGYVVRNKEIVQKYQGGDAILTENPDYTVLLRVTKNYFNEPENDNDLVAFIKLPDDDLALFQAVETVGEHHRRNGPLPPKIVWYQALPKKSAMPYTKQIWRNQ